MKESAEKKPRMSRKTRNNLIRLGVVTLIAVLIMFVLPYIFVSVINGAEGAQLFLLIYYWGNPILSGVIGAYAGWRVKERWYFPVVLPVTYLVSSALLFEALDVSFFQAAGLYLLFSYMTMGLAVMLASFRQR